MVLYINTITNDIGTLKELLPKVSSPENLTETELNALNVMLYTPPPITTTLEEEKLKKISSMADNMESEIQAGLMTSLNIKVEIDNESISNYTQAYILLQITSETSIDIIDYDKVKHTLTLAQYQTLVTELGQNKKRLIYKFQDLKDTINSSTSKEELELINW